MFQIRFDYSCWSTSTMGKALEWPLSVQQDRQVLWASWMTSQTHHGVWLLQPNDLLCCRYSPRILQQLFLWWWQGSSSGEFFSEIIKHMKQPGKNMQEGGQYTNTQICCHLYKDFVEENYTYLCKLWNKNKLPCIPLSWCFELAVKKSSPNEKNQAFVGFKSSQEHGKIWVIVLTKLLFSNSIYTNIYLWI